MNNSLRIDESIREQSITTPGADAVHPFSLTNQIRPDESNSVENRDIFVIARRHGAYGLLLQGNAGKNHDKRIGEQQRRRRCQR